MQKPPQEGAADLKAGLVLSLKMSSGFTHRRYETDCQDSIRRRIRLSDPDNVVQEHRRCKVHSLDVYATAPQTRLVPCRYSCFGMMRYAALELHAVAPPTLQRSVCAPNRVRQYFM